MKNLMNTTIKFKVGKKSVQFDVEHNLPDISGLSMSDAVTNWVHRTDDYTAESLSEYINSKDSGHYCQPYKPQEDGQQ